MNYYIINNSILSYNNEFDGALYNYPKLTKAQADFYELHKCSLNEVLELKLNTPIVPSLYEVKVSKLNYFSQRAFDVRSEILPDYKLINAGLGIYDDAETLHIADLVKAFRNEFYRLKKLIDISNDIEYINNLTDNYESIG